MMDFFISFIPFMVIVVVIVIMTVRSYKNETKLKMERLEIEHLESVYQKNGEPVVITWNIVLSDLCRRMNLDFSNVSPKKVVALEILIIHVNAFNEYISKRLHMAVCIIEPYGTNNINPLVPPYNCVGILPKIVRVRFSDGTIWENEEKSVKELVKFAHKY